MKIKKFQVFEKNEDIDPLGEENWDDNGLPYEYQTTLDILNPIQPRVYRNVYKVTIEHMHGDADAYTHIVKYINEEKSIEIINFCAWVNDDWVRRQKIEEIANIVFGEDNEIIIGDATADGQFPARPRVKSITYFDHEGVEHNIRINKRKIR